MPDQVPFAAEPRSLRGKKVKRLRREGIVPANIFGRHRESVAIQINGLEFSRFLRSHAATTLLRLSLGDGKSETALVRHVEHDPRTSAILHVDFMHVEMNEPIHARIPLHLEGDAPAVKLEDGVLLTLADTLEVEALPAMLPDAITVSVSGLEHVNDAIHVRDLQVPSGVKVLTDDEEIVVKIERPRIVEAVELPPVEEAAPAAEGEAAETAEPATEEPPSE